MKSTSNLRLPLLQRSQDFCKRHQLLSRPQKPMCILWESKLCASIWESWLQSSWAFASVWAFMRSAIIPKPIYYSRRSREWASEWSQENCSSIFILFMNAVHWSPSKGCTLEWAHFMGGGVEEWSSCFLFFRLSNSKSASFAWVLGRNNVLQTHLSDFSALTLTSEPSIQSRRPYWNRPSMNGCRVRI